MPQHNYVGRHRAARRPLGSALIDRYGRMAPALAAASVLATAATGAIATTTGPAPAAAAGEGGGQLASGALVDIKPQSAARRTSTTVERPAPGLRSEVLDSREIGEDRASRESLRSSVTTTKIAGAGLLSTVAEANDDVNDKIEAEEQRRAEELRKKQEAARQKKAEAEKREEALAASKADSSSDSGDSSSSSREDTGSYSGTYHPAIFGGVFRSGFGYRRHPTLGYVKLHNGIDLSAPTGTPVYAVAAGTVISASWYGAGGQTVQLRLDDGTVVLYEHLSGYSTYAGERVAAGETVGYVGSTGRSTGPHLHLGIKVGGGYVNPASWLSARGVF